MIKKDSEKCHWNMLGTLEDANETTRQERTCRRTGRQASKEKRMSELKDGREGKLLIQWPGRQAWRKGFGLSSGPDPCLLDWHSNNPATGLILQITPPPREQRQARIGGEDCAGNQMMGEDGEGEERKLRRAESEEEKRMDWQIRKKERRNKWRKDKGWSDESCALCIEPRGQMIKEKLGKQTQIKQRNKGREGKITRGQIGWEEWSEDSDGMSAETVEREGLREQGGKGHRERMKEREHEREGCFFAGVSAPSSSGSHWH